MSGGTGIVKEVDAIFVGELHAGHAVLLAALHAVRGPCAEAEDGHLGIRQRSVTVEGCSDVRLIF